MSDEAHDHSHEEAQRVRYTIYLDERGAWGRWAAPLVIEGVGSSVQGDELLIHVADGLYSINFRHVRYMRAMALEPSQ